MMNNLVSNIFETVRPQHRLVALVAAMVFGLSSCGTHEDSISDLNVDGAGGSTTSRSALYMKIADAPENNLQPNNFKIWLASGSELEAITVRLCVGDVIACNLPTATYITTKPLVANGKTIYVTDQALTLSQDLILTAVARIAGGGSIIQKTVRVLPVGSAAMTPIIPVAVAQPAVDAECYKGTPLVCEVEKLITQYTNDKRRSVGLGPLTHNPKIAFVSRDWSKKQGEVGDISHNGFTSGARDRVLVAEFGNLADVSLLAENVAMFSQPLRDASAIAMQFTNQWWNSPGHRANMVGRYQFLGSGVAQSSNGSWYGTHLFGNKK